ncbi:MAG: RDD family protein [Luteolibacter sp.]
MEVWLIRNGTKSGPFPDYEIRGRIEQGDLEGDVRAWHEDLPEWTELGKIEIFRKEFERVNSEAVPPPLPKELPERAESEVPKKETDSEKAGKGILVRRFFARWLDLALYSAFWWLGMYLVGKDIGGLLSNPASLLFLTMYVPWFAFEALLIQKFGRTPGKWLMGLRVVSDDGSGLEFKESVWRSIRVMVAGVGFGFWILPLLCQTMSWFTARRIGKPIWDYLGKHKVVSEKLNPFRVIGLIVIFFAAAHLQMAVRGPHEQEIMLKKYPQMEKYFESSERLYFPVKK